MCTAAAEPINSQRRLYNLFPTAFGFTCNMSLDFIFSSWHIGGAQFCLGDGSVRFVNENINLATYRNLGARNDGAALGEF
jgi:hypothetical protein